MKTENLIIFALLAIGISAYFFTDKPDMIINVIVAGFLTHWNKD